MRGGAVLQAFVLVLVAFAIAWTATRVRPVLDWGGNDLELMRHKVTPISTEEAAAALEDAKTLFLDVRPQDEFDRAHVHGAVSFPARDFAAAYEEIRDFLDADLLLILYGDEPLPAVRGAQFLEARGFTPRVLEGGWAAWTEGGLPQNPDSGSPP